jgi:hypothetical protein
MDALAARLQRRSSSLMDLVRMYNVVKVLPVLVEKLQASALFLSLPVLILPSLPTLRSPRSASLVSVRCQAYDGKHAEVLHERFTRPLGVTVTEFSKYAAMVEEVRRCDVALPATCLGCRPRSARCAAPPCQVIEDLSSPEPRVNPSWDSGLEEIAKERGEVEEAILRLADDAASTWGAGLDIKCERDKQRGFVFRAKKAHDKAIRKIPGCVAVVVCAALRSDVVGVGPN